MNPYTPNILGLESSLKPQAKNNTKIFITGFPATTHVTVMNTHTHQNKTQTAIAAKRLKQSRHFNP